MESRGAYTAERASALTGVPKSTVYYWARKNYLIPTASPQNPMLWSFPDLLALRAVYWLRQPKLVVSSEKGSTRVSFSRGDGDLDIPRTKMRFVLRALDQLQKLDLDPFLFEPTEGGILRPTVLVTPSGDVLIHPPGEHPRHLNGQVAHEELIDLLAPMATEEGTEGPDLLRPRPHLRIVPKKLGGAPHVEDTRVETEVLDSLKRRGYTESGIVELYPFLTRQSIRESVHLERQLRRNLHPRAAA